jgi:hypothetical protein
MPNPLPAIGLKATPLQLANRDQRLPKLYQLDSHPLVAEPEGRRIFLYYQDRTKEGSKKALDVGAEFVVPSTGPESIKELGKSSVGSTIMTLISVVGLLCLKPYDIVFARDIHGDQDPKKDVAKVWLIDK